MAYVTEYEEFKFMKTEIADLKRQLEAVNLAYARLGELCEELKRQLTASREREAKLRKALENLWGFTELCRFTEMGLKWIEEPKELAAARAALRETSDESEVGDER